MSIYDTNEKKLLTIACINFHSNWGNQKVNLQRIEEYSIKSIKKGADIILFPEMALTGYDINKKEKIHYQFSEEIPGPSTFEIAKITKEYQTFVVFGMPEKVINDGQFFYYNSAAVIGPEGVLGSYRKMHLIANENNYFYKGDNPFYFHSPWGIVGIGICHDTYMFPELPRFYAALGSKLYLNLTAVPSSHIGWGKYYFNQLRARSFENLMFIASANLVGKEIFNQYVGSSVILGPGPGEAFHQAYTYSGPASEEIEEIIICTIDLTEAENARHKYTLFEKNIVTNTPDWCLNKYIDMLKEVNEKTNGKYSN